MNRDLGWEAGVRTTEGGRVQHRWPLEGDRRWLDPLHSPAGLGEFRKKTGPYSFRSRKLGRRAGGRGTGLAGEHLPRAGDGVHREEAMEAGVFVSFPIQSGDPGCLSQEAQRQETHKASWETPSSC